MSELPVLVSGIQWESGFCCVDCFEIEEAGWLRGLWRCGIRARVMMSDAFWSCAMRVRLGF